MSAISVVLLTLMLWGRQTFAEDEVAIEPSKSQPCHCNDTIFRFSEKLLTKDKDIRLSTFRNRNGKQKVTHFFRWIFFTLIKCGNNLGIAGRQRGDLLRVYLSVPRTE